MAGFDTLYESQDYGDAFLAEVASIDEHIMLSRDIGLLERVTPYKNNGAVGEFLVD